MYAKTTQIAEDDFVSLHVNNGTSHVAGTDAAHCRLCRHTCDFEGAWGTECTCDLDVIPA